MPASCLAPQQRLPVDDRRQLTNWQAQRRIKRLRRVLFESLENRCVLASDTELSALIDGSGNLVIADLHAAGRANQLTITQYGTDLLLTDAVQSFTTVPTGAKTSLGGHALSIPLSQITGSITFAGGGGDDTLTVDLGGGDLIPLGNILFEGGEQTTAAGDSLVIRGGNQGTVTYNYVNAHDGDVVMSNFGTITYTGLEPITNTGNAADVIFSFPGATNAATFADDGTAGNGLSRLSAASFETTTFSNPTNSLTINRGSGNDTIAVNALPDLTSTVVLGGGTTPFSTLTFNGAISLAANRNFSAFAGTISLPNAASDLATSGTGAILLSTYRNIVLSSGASVIAVNGPITFTANMQTPSTSGTFKGVEVISAEVKTTGSGAVTVEGRGGAFSSGSNFHGVHVVGAGSRITSGGGDVRVTGFGGGTSVAQLNHGVVVSVGGEISAGGTGTVTVEGTGGNLTGSGATNFGVQTIDSNSKITSTNGAVNVTGTGGGFTGANSFGVSVDTNSMILAGGTSATTSVTGFGGGLGGGGSQNYGVNFSGGTVTSGGGNVLVTGTGGGTGASGSAFGIHMDAGTVTAGGIGTVTVSGTGGNASGGASGGVRLANTLATITSGGGNVTINGNGGGSAISGNDQGIYFSGGLITAGGSGSITINATGGSGSGTGNYGFYIFSAGAQLRGGSGGITINAFAPNTSTIAAEIFTSSTINTTSTGNITIAADRIDISNATVNVNANTLTLKTTSSGKLINLGGTDSASSLGLTDAELDRITAGTLIIGEFNLGAINIALPITRPTLTNMILRAGDFLTFASGGFIVTTGGTLQLASNGTANVGVRPIASGVEATASTVTLGTNTVFEVNIAGTTVDTNYNQLNVAGSVNLNDATLSFSGAYVPALADSFTIVNNDGADAIVGTFNGLAENAIVTINGVQKRITYVGGTGNDVVIWTPNIVPIITSNGGGATASLTAFTGATTVTTVTASDADIPAQTLTYSLAGGADQARFAIDSVTGALRFLSPVNFSQPTDAGANNVYDVVVQVFDGVWGIDTQTIAVTVTNLLAMTTHRDLIYDPVRQQLLVTTSSGSLLRFDESTKTFIAPIAMGTSLYGGDITADGNFAYVTEGVTGGGLGTIHKANLATGAVTNLTYSISAFEQGGFDLNIADNGLALFTAGSSIGETRPIRQINVATDAITNASRSAYRNAPISRGANRSRLFFQETGLSNGPMFMYTAGGDFGPSKQASVDQGGDLATVSPDGSLVALELNSNVVVFDSTYKAIEQFSAFQGGIYFHPTQNLLLAVDSNADQVVAIDTTTWKERYRVAIGENVDVSGHLGSGGMAVGGNGSTLYLSTGSGIRVLTLPAVSGVAAAPALSDYGTYVLAGSTVNLTVTMRDPSGALVPGYTGTVQFTSTDPAAGLPPNYTFTPADNGKHTFTFTLSTAGSQTITVTDTLTASITRTSAAIAVHTTPTTLLPITNARDLVFDSLRNQLLVTTSTGLVQRYNVASDSLLGALQVSQSLNSADTNLTESALYIQEGLRNAVQGMVRKVDLATGAQSALTYDIGGLEGAGWDLNIASNGLAFTTTRFEGSGGVALRQINVATDAITTVGGVNEDTHISRSADRSRLFLMQSSISSGPTSQYSVASGFTANKDSYVFLDDAMSAISPNGSLIAMELNGNIVVFTSAWQAVEQLGAFNGGMIFHPTQPLLLAVDQNADQIVAFDTTTWQERYRLAIGENVGTSNPLGAGTMAVSADGTKLFLATGTGIRVIPLPAATGVTANILLSNYGTYVNAGAAMMLTVAMRDPAGNVVPNYTGTVQFTSSDPAAGLPPNYTFVAGDAGQKTFNITLNTAGSRTITVTDTTNGSLASTTSSITVHSTPTSLLPITGARDLVFDALRNVLYVTTASGLVQRYHVGSDSLLAPFNVSDSLFAADITAGNGALYLQEGIRGLVQSMVRKIDLTTGAFSNITYDRGGGGEGGGWDLAIAADGMAYFTNSYEGSSAVPYRRIDVATDVASVVPGRTSVNESTLLTRSGNRNRLFLQESDKSSGPTFMYSVPGGYSPTVDSWEFTDANQVAINADGSRIAMEYRGNVVIFDETYHALEQLGGYNGGVAFHPTQNLLLTVNDTTDQLVAFDTTTWKERYRLPIGENVGASTPLGVGTMTVSPDGTKLFMITSGVRVITLPSPTGVPTRVDVTGYGTYLNAGASASLTVTIKDPAGNIVPNYTGTVQFSSTDVAAGLPANYTFTAADAGVRTFTFTLATAGTRTVTVTDTVQPSLTSTTANITVHTVPTTVIPVSNPRDLVYDATRNLLYITTTSGLIQRYSVQQDSLLAPFNVSHNLYALDTSPVNGAIYAVEGISNIAEGMVRKINPDTGSVTNVTFPGGGGEEGGFDFNIGNTGLGLLTGRYDGSGSVDLRRIATATDTVTTSTTIYEFAHVFRNDTRTMLGSVEGSISSGPLRIYNPATGAVTASLNRNLNVDRAFMAINPSGTIVALANHANFVEIYSPTLSLITTIPNSRGSALFKPGTNLLYVGDSLSDTIQVYNGDNAWALVESFPVGEALDTFGLGNLNAGTMSFAPGGNRLFMITPSGVRMYITGDITAPTATGTPGNQSILANTNTGPLGFTVGDNITAAANLVVSATSSNTALIPNANLVFAGIGANRTITVSPASNLSGGPVTITVTVTDEALNTTQFTFSVMVTPATFQVTNFTQTPTGFVLDFNRDLNPATLNLYTNTEGAGIGPIDLILQPGTAGSQPVRGSAIIDPALRKLTFVATTGTLPIDSYTLTLRSAADGFVDVSANLLDGDADGVAGGNYVRNFSVTAPPAGAITIGLPNFSRGPQQAVNVPAAASTGIPISFSDGGGLTSARFNVRYNPALLTITGGTVAPGLPAGTNVVVTITQPGVADVNFTSSSPLPGGTTRFVDLQANVPQTATYRQKHVLDISDIVLSSGVTGIGDDAVHAVAYFGDTTGGGTYTSQDASKLSRLAVGLDGGLLPFQLLDPVIIADLNGNNAITAADSSLSLQLAVGTIVPSVPLMPVPAVSLVQGGPDPKLSIPTDLVVTAGDNLTVPVMIDSIVDLTGSGLESADLIIYYDAISLEFNSVQLGSLLAHAAGNWLVHARNDALAGRLIVSVAGTQPLGGFFQGELVQLQMTAKSDAPGGASSINLAASSRDPSRFTALNEGYLTLIPAPTDADNDPGVDGRVTILSRTNAVPSVQIIGDQLLSSGTSPNSHVIVGVTADDLIRVRVDDQIVGDFARLGRDVGLAPHRASEHDVALLQWLAWQDTLSDADHVGLTHRRSPTSRNKSG